MSNNYLILPRKIMARRNGIEIVEPAREDEAEFFGLYLVDDEGLLEWLEDFETIEAAESYLRRL